MGEPHNQMIKTFFFFGMSYCNMKSHVSNPTFNMEWVKVRVK